MKEPKTLRELDVTCHLHICFMADKHSEDPHNTKPQGATCILQPDIDVYLDPLFRRTTGIHFVSSCQRSVPATTVVPGLSGGGGRELWGDSKTLGENCSSD